VPESHPPTRELRFELRVVERANDGRDRFAEQASCECADLPASEVRRKKDHAAPARPGGREVLDSFVRESRPDVLFCPAGDLQELEEGGAEVLDRRPGDASDLVPTRVGKGAGQVLEEQAPPPARKTQEEWRGAAAHSRSGAFRENPQHSRDEEK